MGQESNWEFFAKTFSASRLSLYLRGANGLETNAQALYLWNSEISSAFWQLLGHVEVALRNKIDSQIQWIEDARDVSHGHWLLNRAESSVPFYPSIEKEITTATSRVSAARKPQSGEQILSELSFGFWQLMVSKGNQKYWPDLVSAFEGLENRNRVVFANELKNLRNFRIRIGHHHRIWNLDLAEKHQEILVFAHLLDPEFSIWLASQSRIINLLASTPI